MKKVLFLIAALILSLQTFTQNSPAGDTCLPVPWVIAEVIDNGNAVQVSWDVPCDTCEVVKYQIVWIDGFDPCADETPEDGVKRHRKYTTGLVFVDSQWWPSPPGYYAFAVKAIYDSCESVWAYSNIIYKDILYYSSLNVTVSLEDGGNPEGANVTVDGATLCNDSLTYLGQSDTEGNTYFEEVMHGKYNLTISKPGYQTTLIEDFIHWKDSTISVELALGPDPFPINFSVDPQTAVANWAMPAIRNAENTPSIFKLYLQDSLVATVAADVFSYQFLGLLHDNEYKASVSAVYGWGESQVVSYTWVTDFVGINENWGNTKVDIFPNPATNQLTIQSEEEILNIELINSSGQIVINTSVDDKQITINTSRFEAGIYIVRVKTNKGISNKRIVIEK